MIKKISVFFIASTLLIFFAYKYFSSSDKNQISKTEETKKDEKSYNSNIIENVKYSSKDKNGNEYIITAKLGEIDKSDSNIIYLEQVNGLVKLNNKNQISISSNFGKYNIDNFDTIFSKNVIITYLNNKINGDYLDFSIIRNSMIISKNVIFTDPNNVIKTDIVEINIKNKNTKLMMYDKENKVSLENRN